MDWRIDLAMVESSLARALEELRKARAECDSTQHYNTATSQWWSRQVHLARERERAQVIRYLEDSGLHGAARDIRHGEHEEL
jgi:hypothetical protein